MNVLATGGFAVVGALAGIPIAAIAYAVPARGSIRLPRQWWRGAPARPVTVVATSILTGAAAGLVAGRLPLSPALPAFWLFAVLGVGLVITDLRRHRLPHAMTGTLWLTSALGLAVGSYADGHLRDLVVAVAAGAGVVVLTLIITLVLPGQLGLGDVSLSGVIAMSLGWLSFDTAVAGLVIGVAVQAAAALVNVIRTRTMRSQMPLGPALLLGWLVAAVHWCV